MLMKYISIVLITLLLKMNIIAIDSTTLPSMTSEPPMKLPTSWEYALFSGSETHPLSITSSSTYISGDVFSNHDIKHRGANLQVDGRLNAVGRIDSHHDQLDVWNQWEDVSPETAPDFGRVIRRLVSLDAEVYDQNQLFEGSDLQVERPMMIKGDAAFKGTEFVGKDYIIASGDITFDVTSLESLDDEPLVLYSEYGDIKIQASYSTMRGILYAPKGTVQIDVSSTFELEGHIIADRIELSGENVEIYGLYDEISLLNGHHHFMACNDRYYELYSEVPFNDYSTPYNTPVVMEIQDLLLESSIARSENIVQSVVLCHAALDKVEELRTKLEEEQRILEQIAADPFGDYDGDGLLNGFELEMLRDYTNPMVYDTDDDGIPDGEEDSDKDGLSNLLEQELGTDPANPDTDGDGLLDGSEYQLGTDPLLSVSGQDGILDSEKTYTQTIVGPVPDVKLEITAVGDISKAVYIHDATDNFTIDPEYSFADNEHFVSGLYVFVAELPYKHARIYLPVDRNKLGDRDIEQVKMVYFDERFMTFLPLEKQGMDPDSGIVWGETDHLGMFALVYPPDM